MKTINRAKFYLMVRNDALMFKGVLPASAVVTMDALIDEFQRRALTLLTWLAYMLATARGEVGQNMAPVREGFAASDAAAQAYVKRNYPHYALTYIVDATGKAVRAAVGLMYYGRGLVQLTWLANYEKFREEVLARFGVDIVANPDAVLRPDIAVYIMFEGMIRGVFTGVKLANFFTATLSDWLGARRIINGVDKKALFGDMGQRFHRYLVAAHEDLPEAPKEIVESAVEREKKITTKTAVGTGGVGTADVAANAADAGGLGWLGWSLIGLAAVVVVIGVVVIIRKRASFKAAWRNL